MVRINRFRRRGLCTRKEQDGAWKSGGWRSRLQCWSGAEFPVRNPAARENLREAEVKKAAVAVWKTEGLAILPNGAIKMRRLHFKNAVLFVPVNYPWYSVFGRRSTLTRHGNGIRKGSAIKVNSGVVLYG